MSFVPKHRVRDARVRKRRREEHTRRALHHSLSEHRLFRSIERKTSSTRVAKSQTSRKRCPFPVSRDDDFSHSLLRLFEKKKNTITVHCARHRAIAQNRRKNAPNRSLRSSMHVAESSLPFLRAFAHLRASLRVTFSSTFSSLKPLFFARIFFLFSPFFSLLSFACAFERHNFERVVRARSEGEPQKNRDPRFARRGSVLFERSCLWRCDECAAFTSHFEHREKMQDLPLSFCFRRSSHLFRAERISLRNRTHATLLSQNNLPKHLKWISTMCETQFFTPCEVHSTSGKVRFETHVQHASCVY